jgi:hypothetical protein
MDKGLEFFRFGFMGLLGVLGMLFLPDTYFNISALIFIIAIGIFFIIMILPNNANYHVARRI